MEMMHNKIKLVLLTALFSLFFMGNVYGGTYFVDMKGSDSLGDGNYGSPWKTVSYALKNVKYGDIVSINDGTYLESQLVVPAGVSLTSTSQDNTKVKLLPNVDMGQSTPFLKLVTSSPGSSGNQTISYIELDGINGTSEAQVVILVQNRNNVRIHHCNIHDFVGTDEETHYAIEIESTQLRRTAEWWNYWPADSQAPGTDTNIDALWPSNPVKNFEFDNNTVKDCFAISPYNLKDSSFHDNTIDNRNTNGWCIKATSAFMNNVDIYNNTLYGAVPEEAGQTPWRVELWLHRNGCEYYNNKMNGYYSITYGKETKIYNNTIVKDPVDGTYTTGIEFNGQSYGEIYGNYISGAGMAVRVGVFNCNKKDWVIENITIRNNKIYNHRYHGIRVEGTGSAWEATNIIVRYINIYDNFIDGQTSEERGDSYYRGITGIQLLQENKVGTCILGKIKIEKNYITDITGYAGVTKGTVSNLVIDNNRFYGNTYNSWNGSIATNTITTDPGLTDSQIVLPPSGLIIIRN